MTNMTPDPYIEEQSLKENRSLKELGKAIHLVLNNTLSRKLTLREYERVIQDIASIISDAKAEGAREERERCLKALPPERIIHGYMPSQITPENNAWNEYRMEAIKAITTPNPTDI